MSEPVSNAEIEDVLSSIRKLVSENNSANRDAKPAEQVVEKLVLTPALRVPAVEEEPQPESSEATPAETAETPEEAVALSDDAPAEPEAVVPESPPRRSSLEDRIAELEQAVSLSHEDWEPDGSEYDDEDSDAMAFDSGVPTGDFDDDSLIDDIEDVEAAAQETRFDEKVDDKAGSDAAGDIDESDAPEAPDTALLDEEADASDAGDRLYPEQEETILDEDALRELVAALVREELQGHVGERITRNVRRLVRREIQRAMSLKDFE